MEQDKRKSTADITPHIYSAAGGSFSTVADAVPARKYFCILTLFSFIVCFSGLFFDGLVSGDETRTAGITAAMHLNGNAVVPYLGDKPFLEYPPLFYWISCGFIRIFGLNDTALKLPVALMAFGSILLVFFSARKLNLPPFESFLAGIIMLSSSQFLSNVLQYRTDMALMFFLMVSIAGYLTSLSASGFRQKAASWLVMTAGLACAVMTKGPIGLAVAASGIGVFVAADDILAWKFRLSRWIFPLSAGIASLIPLAVWTWMLYRDAGPQAVHTVLIFNTVGRVSQKTADHAEPFYYYLVKLPELFQPWLIFLLAGLFLAFRRIRKDKASSALLMVSLILLPFLLFSCASGKRSVYLLSICGFCTFPASLCFGKMLRFLLDNGHKHKLLNPVQKTLPVIWHWLPLLAAAVIFIISLIKGGWFFLLLVFSLLSSVCALVYWKKNRTKASLFTGISLCLLLASVNGTVMQYHVKEDSVRDLYLEAGRVAATENRTLFFYPSAPERMVGSMYYYLHRSVSCKGKYDGISKELWISRDRKREGGTAGGDNHRFYRMPEDLKYFPELKK